jgi:hypothetical protein
VDFMNIYIRTAVLFTGYLMQPKHLRAVIELTKLCLQSPRSKRILMIYMTASVDHRQLSHLMILLSHHSVPVCVMLKSLVLESGYQRKFHIYVHIGLTYACGRTFSTLNF